ncbi:MAG: type I-C CRISPR-associated protein Cas8c/Csd1 [Desulfovibrio aminophilus]|uniref:type I-C CRISPR-associated protein Cas8c/Csd1 n=1 Tax=Desulfovibrio aminophilus TaxID=81425 RepID=UPI0039E8A9CB
MILQELNRYYHRLADDPDSGVAPPGYSEQKVSFCLKLSPQGELLDGGVVDERQTTGKKLVARLMLVPEAVKRTVAIAPNFLCDNSSYVLGADAKDKPERARDCFEAFRALHGKIAGDSDDPGLLAVSRFLARWEPGRAPELPLWDEIGKGANLVFLLEEGGRLSRVHERPAAKEAWMRHHAAKTSETLGQCLITGRKDVPIAQLHAAIKGVPGAQSSGAALVSFNLDAFTSYGKEQNLNAPVAEDAAFAYTTALNSLLRPDSLQRVLINDMAFVFWAERKCPAEGLLGALFNPPSEKDVAAAARGEAPEFFRLSATDADRIRHVLLELRKGRPAPANIEKLADPAVRFYLLGLAPNAARLVVRFWETCTFGQLLERVGRHYADAALEDADLPQTGRILLETAAQRDRKNIPPLLNGALMRAIITGGRYPLSLYSALLERIRADHEVNATRAAMIKAVLKRNFNMEVSMGLDTNRQDVAYRLGRLFAVLESLQYQAIKPQATIKDRFFGSASATPANVFPTLLHNAQHHIGKVGWGDQPIQEILDAVDEFPAHLDMQAQGLFSIGYYHQRKQIFDDIAARKAAKKDKE